MREFKNTVKDTLRPVRDIVFVVPGFIYDFIRYFRYAGWYRSGPAKRDYRAVKIYHRLEKSLSFRNRRPESGTDAVLDLFRFFRGKDFNAGNPAYQERVGLKVLSEFLPGMKTNHPRISEIKTFSKDMEQVAADEGGAIIFSEQRLLEGKLENPERFFMSRYSVRDFQSKPIDKNLIRRALHLAMKSPSVCSRQAWHVYHIEKRELIDRALSLQNGNRGFGHEIPSLLIITADLAAFDTASERYQYWIDGGMFSMSMLLALHSLGLGACCLNWSKGPVDDIKLRRIIKIKGPHTIMMMMAVGYAREEFKVCSSVRRPAEEVYTLLE